MSPVIRVGLPEVAVVNAAVAETTEDVTRVQDAQEPVKEAFNVLMEEEQVSPAVLATLFLVLGIVVFVAVMLKRLTTRPEMIQCSPYMKPAMFSYGSIVYSLDGLYKEDNERRAFFRSQKTSCAKTRPTRFISVSDMWKEQQSKNNREISRIPEEPEDTESSYQMAFFS